MIVPTYTYPRTLLFRMTLPLGISLVCLLIFGTGGFALPPHSSPDGPTLGSAEAADPHLRLQSGIVGLALHITATKVGEPARLIIRAVHPSGPAARGGIHHGEEISSVNGQPITGKTYQEAVSLIRGEIGTSVKLGLQGPQGERMITIVRVNESILMEQTPQTM